MAEGGAAARRAALYVLGRCRRFDAWSQQTLESAGEKFSLDQRDRALCTRLCRSVLQNAALCDYYIGYYCSVPAARLEPQIRDILRLGVCQILFMDRIPVPAAVSEAVTLAKQTRPGAAGLVNAVLRRVGENRQALPALPDPGTARELSIAYSHPLWLCQRLMEEHGYDFAAAFLRENNREPPRALSVNLCRATAEGLIRRLAQNGCQASASPLSPVSVLVENGGGVTALPGYREGEFFVQDAGAALAVLSAGPREGMRVLDACAAPGGKSFLCASLMGDRGEILACDLHEKKLERIRQGAERLGFASIRTSAMDAARPEAELAGRFDLVLADVPCSGLGVIRRKPEIRYRDPAELERLPEVQLSILRGLKGCVRPGGVLAYSTCTVRREENEEVLAAFLAENPAFVLEESRTLWPHIHHTDGFFMGRLRRNVGE